MELGVWYCVCVYACVVFPANTKAAIISNMIKVYTSIRQTRGGDIEKKQQQQKRAIFCIIRNNTHTHRQVWFVQSVFLLVTWGLKWNAYVTTQQQTRLSKLNVYRSRKNQSRWRKTKLKAHRWHWSHWNNWRLISLFQQRLFFLLLSFSFNMLFHNALETWRIHFTSFFVALCFGFIVFIQFCART